MKKTISIRINLLTYFALVTGLIISLLLGLQYRNSIELAEEAAGRTFQQLAAKTSLYIENRDSLYNSLIEMIANDRQLSVFPQVGENHPALKSFVSILKNDGNIFSIYVGKENGDFFQVIDTIKYHQLTDEFQLSDKPHWATIHIDASSPGLKNWIFYNEQLEQIATRQQNSRYNPSNRPWFNKARQQPNVIRTAPYLFSLLDDAGITYAKSMSDGRSVLGMDITMATLNDFLTNQKTNDNNEIFLYDKYGEKFASSDLLSVAGQDEQPTSQNIKKLELTDAEQQFVAANPRLIVSNEIDWPPIDFALRGKPLGYSIDYLQLLADKMGIELRFVNGYTWSELMTLFKDGGLDLLHSAYYEADREQFALFSKPIHNIKNMIIHRNDQAFKSMDDLNGKTIAVPEGWSTIDFIKANYPQINVKPVPSSYDTYFAVSRGEVDALIDHELSMQFITSKFELNNLSIGPWFQAFDDNKAKNLHIMVSPDQPLLITLINRAIDAITPDELDTLQQRWANPFCARGQQCDNAVISRDNIVHQLFTNPDLQANNSLLKLSRSGIDYFGYSAGMPTFGDLGIRLGMTEPADRFINPFLEKISFSMQIAFAVSLLIFPVVFYATRKILEPIKALMLENDKISARQFDRVARVNTNIKEMLSLSDSLIDLSKNVQKYELQQQELMDSFIHLIATAIDTKSPYTGGHCTRVPDIARLLAEAASQSNSAPFKDFAFTTEDEWREFKIGSWLHDCGKVTTPEYVVDKATKLETIDNRINEIRTRFDVLWRDRLIEAGKRLLEGESLESVEQWKQASLEKLQDDFAFIAECNIGGEYMSDDKIERLNQIAGYGWQRYFSNRLGLSGVEMQQLQGCPDEQLPCEESLLADKPEHVIARDNFDHQEYAQMGFKSDVPEALYNRGELYNLSIRRGTLTEEERFKINDHVIQTIRMLETLPLPEHLQKVPEYAGTHHETLIGTGYPRKLTKEQLSIPARIMALADVFEALTASDRPYKKAKTLTEALKIMSFMVKDQHIDKDIFELFLRSEVYLKYARSALMPQQIDEVNIEDYLPG